MRTGAALIVIGIALLAGAPASAVKRVSTDRTEVDGHIYKIIRYDNNSVMVVLKAVILHTPPYVIRDRMRRAVEQAIGCPIKDDFLSDGKLIGSLACPMNTTATGAR